jgi:hypothetical protein
MTSDEEAEAMLVRLQKLLERQLELVHRGNLAAAEKLFEQTEPCVRAIAETPVPDVPTERGERRTNDKEQSARGAQHMGSRESVERLYEELSLAVMSQREETAAALTTVRGGRRMLRTYASHLSAK